jgi:flagellar motility protein MotE (MotC chaperone)
MLRKLLHAIRTVVVCCCVATVIAQAIVIGTLVARGKLDRPRFAQVLAILAGHPLPQHIEGIQAPPRQGAEEHFSYEQVLEARAVKYRNLELREQALRDGVAQLRLEQRKLAEESRRLQQLREGFAAELASLREGATAAGMEEVRRTLENLKPKQAKEQILKMLDADEMGQVVELLSAMPDTKRAKILAEFKTPEEAEKLNEILRRIRIGAPAAERAEAAREKLRQLPQGS